MENQKPKSQAAQGAAEAKSEVEEMAQLSPVLVKEYLKKDLSIAVSCLNAILTDPDLLEQTAHFMFGRLENSKSKPAKLD